MESPVRFFGEVPPSHFPFAGGRMTRRFRVPATAFFLSSIMAMTGSVSQDAIAEIVVLSQATGASIVQEEGHAKIRSAADFAPHLQRKVSSRYWIRGIVLLLTILLMLWLIYRTFTGWKPLLDDSCGIGRNESRFRSS
jgi:hypothetical protein